MNHLRRILAAAITLTGTVLALATAPAAFARPLPPPDCTWPRSPDGAPDWPDGCGIYQRRLFLVEAHSSVSQTP